MTDTRIVLPPNLTDDVYQINGVCYQFVGYTFDAVSENANGVYIDYDSLPDNFAFGDCYTCQITPAYTVIEFILANEESFQLGVMNQTDEITTFLISGENNTDPFNDEGPNSFVVELLDASPVWVSGLSGSALNMSFGCGTTPCKNRAEVDGVDFSDLHGVNGEFTYEAILKFDSIDPDDYATNRQILSMNNGDVKWYISKDGSNLRITLSNSTHSVSRILPTTGGSAINTTDWFYTAAVFNPESGYIQLYWVGDAENNVSRPSALGTSKAFSGHSGFTNKKLIIGNREGASENFLGIIDSLKISDTVRCPSRVRLNEDDVQNINAIKIDEVCGCYSLFSSQELTTTFFSNITPIATYSSLNECLFPSPSPVAVSVSPSFEDIVAPFAAFAATPSPSPAEEAFVAPVLTETPTPSPNALINEPSPQSRIYRLVSSPSPTI